MTRRLAAIVVADVVGYSRLLAQDEAGTLAALKERRKAVVEPLVRQHTGRIVKFMGDGVLIEFASAVNAVAFALDLQRRMAEMSEPLPEARRIVLRVGINLGDVVGDGADIFGAGVNIAARLEAVAEPGGICVSSAVHDQVRGKLDLRAEDLGEQQLKNISSPVRCWRISAAHTASIAAHGPSGDRISIAVLPFLNMSADLGQDHFVDGLTEDLITALAKFRWFSVLSRNATFQFKGRAVDIPAIGRQLGARYVLEGSIRSGSNRIRVTAQLIDVETGAHVWAEKFDREIAEAFAVQDEIVSAISGQLHGAAIDAAVAAKRNSTTLSAYDHLIRGRSSWRRGAVIETMQHYEHSAQADPNYSAALASLAFIFAEDTFMQVSGLPISELQQRAVELAERAIAVDDGDAFAHQMVGTAFLDLGELDRAKQHLELALTLNPHFPSTTINLGCTIAFMGSHREGLALIAKVFRIDARLPPAMQAVPFMVHSLAGHPDEALGYLKQMQNPYAYLHMMMAVCFAHFGRMDEARQQLALFEAKRTSTFEVLGLAAVLANCLRLQEDKSRLIDGFRKLGIEV